MKTLCLWICAYCVSCAVAAAQANDSAAALLERIKRGEYGAMLDAGQTGDTNLVPYLENRITANPADPSTEAAKMALARLGVKKYANEIVAELTNSTVDAPGPNGAPPTFTLKHERLWAQMEAFRKLAYIKDRSTVRVIASYLYMKVNPEDYVERSVKDATFFEVPCVPAVRTLAQIVDNPPVINLAGTNDTFEARLKIWQQWWEQNKDKYPRR